MKGERKMKIKKICIMALIIVLISSFATRCFAVTEATEATNNSKITKEQLNEKFQELKDNDSEIEKIVTGDNVIEVIKSNDKYEIKYEIEEDKVRHNPYFLSIFLAIQLFLKYREANNNRTKNNINILINIQKLYFIFVISFIRMKYKT